MQDLFENFKENVEKEYRKRFDKQETYSSQALLQFFQSYCGQIRYFSQFLQRYIDEKPNFSEFHCLFSLYSWLDIVENERVSTEKPLQILRVFLQNYENIPMNCIESRVFLDFARKLKRKCSVKEKESNKNTGVSFFNKIVEISCVWREGTQKPANSSSFIQFLVLFEDYVRNLGKKSRQNQNYLQKLDKIYELFQLVFLELALKNPSFSIHVSKDANFKLFLSIFQEILYSFKQIHEKMQDEVKVTSILMKYLCLLDDLLKNLNESSNNKEETIIFMMGLIITSQNMPKATIKFIIDNLFFPNKIYEFLNSDNLKSNSNRKNSLVSNKFYLNLIKIFADALDNQFNSSYFEEVFFVLDEYVLHLIEPSFSKLFSIICNKSNTTIHRLEKDCIRFLIKKALTHK